MQTGSTNWVQDSHMFRRQFERKNYCADVVFVFKDELFQGTMKDICIGGAFIKTKDVKRFWVGDEVTTTIPFTDGSQCVKRSGRILWKNNIGFAMQFSN